MTIANNGGRSKFDQDTEVSEGKCGIVIVSTSNKPLSELVQGDMKEGYRKSYRRV
jgi:hypothetical protein